MQEVVAGDVKQKEGTLWAVNFFQLPNIGEKYVYMEYYQMLMLRLRSMLMGLIMILFQIVKLFSQLRSYQEQCTKSYMEAEHQIKPLLVQRFFEGNID